MLGTQLAFLMVRDPCMMPNRSLIAPMQTPNFAMDTTDIDHNAPPEQRRCTAHIIKLDTRLPVEFVSGSPLRISASPQFRPPPDILFDAVYASFILHHFGTKRMKDGITKEWKDSLYSGSNEVMTTAHTDNKAITDEHATTSERTQAQAWDERRAKHHGPDTMDMVMALPYLLVPPNELQAEMRAAKEKAEAAEQRHVQERVEGWIRQVNAA